jgi:hypothetical protein
MHATLAVAVPDRHLADQAHQLAKMPEPIFVLAPPRIFSFDRRDQVPASAIQRARLAGSRFASCLHSRIRELSSVRLIIGAPASGSIYYLNLR